MIRLWRRLRRTIGQAVYSAEYYWALVTRRRSWLLRRHFNRWARWETGKQMESDHQHMTDRAFTKMVLSTRDRILELGCGTGWAANRLSRKMGQAGMIVGLDISDAMLSQARVENAGVPNLAFVQALGDQLPFRNESFSKIFSIESFYFFERPERAAREMLRTAARGGEIYIAVCLHTANPDSLEWLSQLNMPVHVSSPEDYRNLFAAAGWSDVQLEMLGEPDTGVPRRHSHERALLITARKD